MATSIQAIYESILAEKANHPELDVLNSSSKTAIYKLWAYVTAVCIWAHEKLWDAFKTEVDTKIQDQKVGKTRWYRDKALSFQYGQNLPSNSDVYDNTGLTDAQVLVLKIIKYASVTEIDGKLRIKVAKQVAGLPAQLSIDELTAFSFYVEKIKFSGVKINKDSLPADNLKLLIDIWYDPLVLKSDGSRIDGLVVNPVKDAIKGYLNQLPFNGEYANTRLTDYLQKVDGVGLPVIKSAQAKYGLLAFAGIDEKYIPDAGYLTIADADLTINFREYVQF
ncbi:MAG: hypothetical protein Q8K66_13080 [Sediminibacterium sp.]|nr:hypothetical protein [Sediminibacterium sp.]MDP3128832.1 hypothetical protein [Sediminibacterium sp.]